MDNRPNKAIKLMFEDHASCVYSGCHCPPMGHSQNVLTILGCSRHPVRHHESLLFKVWGQCYESVLCRRCCWSVCDRSTL